MYVVRQKSGKLGKFCTNVQKSVFAKSVRIYALCTLYVLVEGNERSTNNKLMTHKSHRCPPFVVFFGIKKP